jgi:50S ribosomal subunit-associated GTPase HflX
MNSVEQILDSLDLKKIPRIEVFNKIDLANEKFYLTEGAVGVSALEKKGLEELLNLIEKTIWESKSNHQVEIAFSTEE